MDCMSARIPRGKRLRSYQRRVKVLGRPSKCGSADSERIGGAVRDFDFQAVEEILRRPVSPVGKQYPEPQGLFWRGRQRGVFRNDGSRLLGEKFLLLGRKAPVSADPLAHLMGFEFGDEIFSPRSVMGMPSAIAIASWHSLMEIIGGVRKRFLNASSSAMMARACVVRSSFSLGVKRLSPLTHCLSMTLRSVMSICSPPNVTVMPRVVMSLPLNCQSLRHGTSPPPPGFPIKRWCQCFSCPHLTIKLHCPLRNAQSCHVKRFEINPATRNLNCPSAITDGSLRHALLPPVGSARPGRPDRTGTRTSRFPPPGFPIKRAFSGARASVVRTTSPSSCIVPSETLRGNDRSFLQVFHPPRAPRRSPTVGRTTRYTSLRGRMRQPPPACTGARITGRDGAVGAANGESRLAVNAT